MDGCEGAEVTARDIRAMWLTAGKEVITMKELFGAGGSGGLTNGGNGMYFPRGLVRRR